MHELFIFNGCNGTTITKQQQQKTIREITKDIDIYLYMYVYVEDCKRNFNNKQGAKE